MLALMQRPLFIGSDIYRGSSYGGWHPLRVPRVSTVIDLSRAMGWLPP
ncbi:MAG: acetoin utilization protein AcuC, partial [Pseudomonadota bacterium]